jgi:beta-barrel assembly-enhancing protease
MKKMFFLGILLLMTTISTGCAVSRNNIRGFNIVSLDEEKQLGDKFAVEVEKQRQVVTDPAVQNYMNQLGNRLLTGVRTREFNFTFKVVKDDSVNAFAVPGGHIYVHSGLIKAAKSESELAAVMAHEISHAVARHGTQQLTQQYGASLVLQLLLGQDSNLLSQLASSLFTQGAFMAYSRSMESQADYLGVETMYRAGYDPRGMISFLNKLAALHQSNPGKIAQFFSSHPMTSERIQQVQLEISKLPPKSFRSDSTEFKQIQARI